MPRKPDYRARIDLDKKLTICTINVPSKMLVMVEKFIEWGLTPSRSEYMRTALAVKLEADMKYIKTIDKVIEEDPSTVRIPKENGEIQTYKVLRRLE